MTPVLSKSRLADLLERAKAGTISPVELRAVAENVRRDHPDLYTLLHILGQAGDSSYRKVILPYLEFPQDPQVSALVIWIVCVLWGECDTYKDKISSYLAGVEWDLEDDIRLKAITVAGEYLRDNPNDPLLRDLLNTFDGASRAVIRNAAYFALLRAYGLEWTEVPEPRAGALDRAEVDIAVLDALRARVRDMKMN